VVQLAAIVAAAENGVIGRNNALPWRLPGDLQYFKRVTMGKPIIMGRKTFESIGKPLPGRSNIVITRNAQFQVDGVRAVNSLAAALRVAEDIALIDGVDEVVVIGGAEVYRESLSQVSRLYLTQVHASVEGDAYMPEVEWSDWRETTREHFPAQGANPYDYSFVVFERCEG